MRSIFFKKSGSKKIDILSDMHFSGGVILGDSQEILFNELTERLRILRTNVAMVPTKLFPRTF